MELGKDKKEACVHDEGEREFYSKRTQKSVSNKALYCTKDTKMTLENVDDKIVLDGRVEVLLKKPVETRFQGDLVARLETK
jgi:hypothetical protein